MRTLSWLPLVSCVGVSCIGGCLAVLDFDVRDEAGSGGATGAGPASSSTDTGSSSTLSSPSASSSASSGDTSSGGGCAGCLDGDACRTGDDADACGQAGEACVACEGAECKEPTCAAGACALVDAPDDTSCTGGRCRDGACDQTLENCTDDADNDGDGAADCADETCAGLVGCIPAPPTGWEGPVAVYEDALTGDPGCPASFSIFGPPLYTGLDDSAFSCGTCTCDTACTARVSLFRERGCITALSSESYTEGACVDTLPNPQVQSLQIDTLSTCTAQLDGVVTTPASFTRRVILCENQESGSGCDGDGDTCRLVAPERDVPPATCVVREGKHECPATGFTVARSAWSDSNVDDQRTCTNCTCLPPSPDCGGAVTAYEDALCTTCNLPDGVCDPLPPGCYPVDGLGGVLFAEYQSANTCTATGTTIQGAVALQGERTICCIE